MLGCYEAKNISVPFTLFLETQMRKNDTKALFEMGGGVEGRLE